MTQQEAQEKKQKYDTLLLLEFNRNIMSWDNDLRKWYKYALIALQHVSPAGLRIRCEQFTLLLEPETHGLTLWKVMILCNALEFRSAYQMSMTVTEWADVLKLNAAIGERWTAMADPIQTKLMKQVQSQITIPKMQLIMPGAEA